MINIDGSYGEGGGQILRNAIAFSVLFNEKVNINNIRAIRPNPGIKPQHFTAINIIKEICNADTKGLEIGSNSISFKPNNIKTGLYEFDIGTAGSIVLVFQACILSFLNAKSKITINLRGGTDVKWSPSWDYFENVYVKLIRKMGLLIKPKLLNRGYYPKGGGKAMLSIEPSFIIKPLSLRDEQEFKDVKGIINIANLPEHISKRMRNSSYSELIKNGLKASINIDSSPSLSPGTGITLWTSSKDTILGKTMIGEKGVTAESIGESTSKLLINEIKSKATIDVNAIDQILPFMFLAEKHKSSYCSVNKLSNHTKTNIWLINHFIKNENLIDIKSENGLYNITIKGINFFK